MHDYPTLRPLSAVAGTDDDPLAGGHLWLREFVDGAPVRLSVTDAGLIRFGDGDRVLGDDVPLPYRAAARAVRASFDRDALRRAVDDPTAITFFGVATRLQSTPYDFDRLPPFVGTEVARDDRRLPVDAAERVFERLGLPPVDTLAKEVHVRDFHPDRYAFPDSTRDDGPVAGVVVRNRTGARALLADPDARTVDPDPNPDPEAVAASVPAERLRTAAAADPDPTAVADRLTEALVRERYAHLYARPARFDPDVLRSALRRRASRLVDDPRPDSTRRTPRS